MVLMALLLLLSTGTSTNDFLTVLKNVPPGGYAAIFARFFVFFIVKFVDCRRCFGFW